MRDKPGKPRDYYHSCYALSGLSISQCCVVSSGGSSGSSSSSSSGGGSGSSSSGGGSGDDDGDNNDGYTSTGEMDCIDNSFEGSSSSGSSSSSSSYSQENMKTAAFTDWTGAQVRTLLMIILMMKDDTDVKL